MVFPSIEGALCYFDEYVSTDDGDAVGSSLLFGSTTSNTNFTLCSSSRDVDAVGTTTTTSTAPRINITNKTIENVLNNNNKENKHNSNSDSNSRRIGSPPDLTEASSSGSEHSPSLRSSSTTNINSLFDDEDDDDVDVPVVVNAADLESYHHRMQQQQQQQQERQQQQQQQERQQQQPQQQDYDEIEFAVLSSYHNKRAKSPRSGCCVDLDDVDDDDKNNNRNSNNNVDVLTRDIMSQLQNQLPTSKRGESFWLKYSMVHDGAALSIMLDKVAGCDTTVLAIETIDGDVFGAFCTASWKINQQDGWYGNGSDTFLWRLQESRGGSGGSTSSSSNHQHIRRHSKNSLSLINDDDSDNECEQRDSSPVTAPKEEGGTTKNKRSSSSSSQPEDIHEPIQVFKFVFCNHNVQQCNHNRLMIGGGHKMTSSSTTTNGSDVDGSSFSSSSSFVIETKWGYGLSLDQDLLKGSTSSCLTYDSPSLIASSSNGNIQHGGSTTTGGGGGCSVFEVRNLEVWALTPFVSLEEAKRSYDRKRRFL